MNAIGCRSRGAQLTATAAFGCLALCSPAVRAGEAVVTASNAVVRTAPFEVAPVLTHLYAGDKLTADDWPQGGWRRVKLPDGRFGLVHDADVKVTVTAPAPLPRALTVMTPAPLPSALQNSGTKPDPWREPPRDLTIAFAALPVWQLFPQLFPQQFPPPPISARASASGIFVPAPPALAVVTSPNAIVRTAPFEVAPELTHLHAGDKLAADDMPVGAWRRVKLPDGRFGLIHDADVKVTVTTQTAPAPVPPPPRLMLTEPSPPPPPPRLTLTEPSPVPPPPRLTLTEPSPVPPPLRLTLTEQQAIVMLPASGRGIAASVVQYARELLIMDLVADLRLYVINYAWPPIAIQPEPHVLAWVAGSVGGRLAVALDVSREAGVTTFDVTCYDAATAETVCHARESTTAGPEVVPAITAIVAAETAQGFDVRAGSPSLVQTPREPSILDGLPPHTFRLGVRGLVMVPVVMVRRQPEPLGGAGLTVTANVTRSFIDLLGDYGTSAGPYTLGIGAGFYWRLSDGGRAPFVGASVHYITQHFGGLGAAGWQLRPTVGYALWRDQPIQVRVDLSYFVDLFRESTGDRLIKGYDARILSHGPMLALGAAF